MPGEVMQNILRNSTDLMIKYKNQYTPDSKNSRSLEWRNKQND